MVESGNVASARLARRRREADRDIVEDKEESEEAEAEKGNSCKITLRGPLHPQQQSRRQHAEKADAPAQNRKRDRIGTCDQITTGDRCRGAAEAAR